MDDEEPSSFTVVVAFDHLGLGLFGHQRAQFIGDAAQMFARGKTLTDDGADGFDRWNQGFLDHLNLLGVKIGESQMGAGFVGTGRQYFFQLADLFVCTIYEESFPRVVLEAMAFRTPIVSTDVHGIAEMVRQRAEAYLVKPGDAEGLSRMMRTCLAKERSGKSLTPTAYSKALRYYNYAKVLPYHVALAREAYLAPPP